MRNGFPPIPRTSAPTTDNALGSPSRANGTSLNFGAEAATNVIKGCADAISALCFLNGDRTSEDSAPLECTTILPPQSRILARCFASFEMESSGTQIQITRA